MSFAKGCVNAFLTLAEPRVFVASVPAVVVSVAVKRDVDATGLAGAPEEGNLLYYFQVFSPSVYLSLAYSSMFQ